MRVIFWAGRNELKQHVMNTANARIVCCLVVVHIYLFFLSFRCCQVCII